MGNNDNLVPVVFVALCAAFTAVSAAGGGAFTYDVKSPGCIPVAFKDTPEHEPLQLIADGEPRFALLYDKKDRRAANSVWKGAAYIALAVSNATGRLPGSFALEEYAAATNRYKYLIVLGDNAYSRRQGVDPFKLPKQGYEIKTFNGGVVIAGHDTALLRAPGASRDPLDDEGEYRGTIWGAVDFTERFLGVRVFYPGPYGFIAPRIADLKLEPVNYTDAPRFINRESYSYYLNRVFRQRGEMWRPLLGLADTKAVHSQTAPNMETAWRLDMPDRSFHPGHDPDPVKMQKFYSARTNEIFFTAPNGYMHINPKRHIGNGFDMTNLGLAEIIIDAMKKYYASNGKEYNVWEYRPNRKYVNLGQCDGMIPTIDLERTPIVKELNLITPEDKAAKRAQSQVYARFTAHFAKRVKEEFPGLKVAFMPYQGADCPPLDKTRWPFPDNVVLRHCTHAFPAFGGNPEKLNWTMDIVREWCDMIGGKPIDSFYFYHIPEGTGSPFLRAVASKYMGDSIRQLGKYLGDHGIFYFQYEHIDFSYYYSEYCAAKAFWAPGFDVESAIEEHWEPFYGKEAGGYLREFYKELDRCYKKYFLFAKDSPHNPVYQAKDLDRFEDLLHEAEEALKADPDSIGMKRFLVFARPWKSAIVSNRNRLSYECPVYLVRRLMPENVDVTTGMPTDAFWKDVRPMRMFDPTGGDAEFRYPAEFRLAWNAKGIYGRVTAPFKPLLDRSASIWRNDSFEMLISQGLGGEKFYQYVLDAGGQLITLSQEILPIASPENKSWKSPGFIHHETLSDVSWSTAFFIPFEDLKSAPPKTYASWKANFVMNKLGAPAEYSSSSMCLGINKNIPMFSILKFAGIGEFNGAAGTAGKDDIEN